jgi:prevent-host-death family protein
VQVNILEAKNRLSQLIKSAQAGEDVVIANRGEPVARLVATAPQPRAPALVGSGPGLVAWLAANPLPAHLQREHEGIEAQIAEEREGWD